MRHGKGLLSAISLTALTAGWAIVSPPPAVAVTADILTASYVTTNRDAAKKSASFALEGTIQANNGKPVGNTPMQVNLDPSSAMLLASEKGKGEAVSLPLARTRTDNRGRFRVTVPALKGIEKYADSDRTVQLLFISLTGSYSTLYRVSVVLPTTAGASPQSLNPDEKALDSKAVADARKAASRLASAGLVAPQVSVPVRTVNLPATSTTSKAGAVGTLGIGGQGECVKRFGSNSFVFQWRMVTNPIMRPQMYVPVQKVVTKGRTTGKFEWKNGREVQTTTGVSFSYSGAKGEGGYVRMVNQEGGVNFNVPHNSRYELQTNTEYRFYDLYCASQFYVPYQWKSANVWELRPYDWTGGSRRVNSTTYSCSYLRFRQQIPAGSEMWTSRSTSYTRTNSIGYGAFKLDTSQKNTTLHKKTYSNTSRVSATLCGQDGQPTKTDKVSEV